ncbi:hypothetical protein [Sandarakinorhabdus sp.]|uniref:hypothetical protein n=1 Tax=Sandarakinorhabdus sp. TaxID=1916663 RepID=UPI00286EAD41|nr:hypothetical protein [Sandarakinorhabdus sp.]
MIYIWLNALPILAANIAGLLAASAIDRPRSPGGWLTAFFACAWLCAILAGALILAPPKGGVWVMTIGSAFVIWLGFVVPVLAVSLRHVRQRWRSVLRQCGWWLMVMAVQAVVLRLIGLVPPPVG